ncbi:hypothetical protein GGF50DRAFT_102625, partial [Schizophyllum commune]
MGRNSLLGSGFCALSWSTGCGGDPGDEHDHVITMLNSVQATRSDQHARVRGVATCACGNIHPDGPPAGKVFFSKMKSACGVD